MKKSIYCIIVLILTLSLSLSALLFVNAEPQEDASIITCNDIVETDSGRVEFREIDPIFKDYNINRCSDKIDTTNTIDKVMVLSTTDANTVFTFKTHLNRDYLTKYFNILEWFIVPTKVQPYGEPLWGNEYSDADFESFEITVKDVNNPAKYFVFRTTNRPDSDTYCTVVSGRAGANGQSVNGIHQSSPNTIDTSWGTTLKASHVGSFSTVDGVPSGFNGNLPLGGFVSLDYETKKVFSVTGEEEGKRVLVRDLDDGKYMIGTDVPWEGFDSKELEVSVRFLNIASGRTASVAILGFNGMDFTKGQVIDETVPNVIEKNTLAGETLFGEKDRFMPIPEFFAYDLLDGYISDIDYSVYYNYGKDSEAKKQIIDGKFKPDVVGTYTVVASSTDRFGNIGKGYREIDIRNVINDLQIETEYAISESYNVGEKVYLPNAYVYGGTLDRTYSVSVLYGDTIVDITENNFFIPENQGLYTVRYTVSDYYREPKNFDFNIVATISDRPVVSFPILPAVVAQGEKFIIPEFFAKDYSSFGYGVDADITFELKTPESDIYNVVSNGFVPDKEGVYTLKITASSILDKSKYVSENYEFLSKKCKFVRDYFITENLEIVERNRQMVFNTNGNSGGFYFLNPIISDGFLLNFAVKDNNGFVPQIKITLSDMKEKDNFVTLVIEKNKTSDSILKTIDGECVISGAVGTDKGYDFNLSYKNGWIYDGNTAAIKLNNYDNGKPFDGFSSGKFNIEMYLDNASENTMLTFSDFCGNRDFSYNADDITEPVIITSDLGRIYGIGDIVEFSYISNDLFDLECDVSVKVEINGKVISEGENGICRFAISEFGKYQIFMRSSDRSGNETNLSFNIYCYDKISPTLKVTKNVQRELELGKSLSLPDAIVSDNIDKGLNYSVYASKPGGAYVIIENNTFVPDVKGDWVIRYYAVDSCGNYAIVAFNVKVK